MLRVVSSEEMRQIDKLASTDFNIPSLILMENAGRSIIEGIENYINSSVSGLKVWVFCGRGNNGGDGFVAARHLLNRRAEVEVFLLGSFEELKGDALVNAQIYKEDGNLIYEIKEENDLTKIRGSPDIIVDAIFGTGFSGKVEGIYEKVIQLINSTDALVVACDIPSGVCEDGLVFGEAIEADLTVTLGFIKRCLLLPPGRDYAGKVYIGDIGIFEKSFKEKGNTFLIEEDDIRAIFPERISWGHKGTFGTVLVVAGSKGFSGAASLTALGALKIGAGLVRLAVPEEIISPIEAKLTEVVKIPLKQNEDGLIKENNLLLLKEAMKDAEALALGPGIGTKEGTKKFVIQLLKNSFVPIVLDADGVNCLIGETEVLKEIKSPLILTPHPGELGRLLNLESRIVNEQRVELAKDFSQRFNLILVLKGSPTVIASPEGKVYINPTGNSGLASGGTGDVLTGFIAGLLAQGLAPLEAAIAGVYLHGLCADIGAKKKTEYAFIATDILEFLPKAIKTVLK